MTNKEAVDCFQKYLCEKTGTVSKIELGEALIVAIEALEKQIPMTVKITTSTKRCGKCNRQLSGIGNIHPERNYCTKCGQAIDWSEEG